MRPMRSFGGGGGGGFGFPSVESTAARLAIGLVVGSVLSLAFRSLGALLVWNDNEFTPTRAFRCTCSR